MKLSGANYSVEISMFTQSKLLFLYAITPVHMGAGQAIGVVDNPIQRERHTHHPNMAGSGIKGAIRHQASLMGWDPSLVKRLFGPESGENNLYAGAVSFGDAQIVAFPVRSLKQGYVYVVSPTSLARLKRLAGHVGINADWEIPAIDDEQARVCDDQALSDNQLVLEAYQFTAMCDDHLKKVASWLATHSLPGNDGNRYFANKLKTDLVLLPDQAFSHFVEYATSVEAHVRIDEKTGTAKAGGLFYTENLPPESLLVAPALSSGERYPKDSKPENPMSSEEVIAKLQNGLQDRLLQIGGDATIGRGQMLLHFAGGGL